MSAFANQRTTAESEALRVSGGVLQAEKTALWVWDKLATVNAAIDAGENNNDAPAPLRRGLNETVRVEDIVRGRTNDGPGIELLARCLAKWPMPERARLFDAVGLVVARISKADGVDSAMATAGMLEVIPSIQATLTSAIPGGFDAQYAVRIAAVQLVQTCIESADDLEALAAYVGDWIEMLKLAMKGAPKPLCLAHVIGSAVRSFADIAGMAVASGVEAAASLVVAGLELCEHFLDSYGVLYPMSTEDAFVAIAELGSASEGAGEPVTEVISAKLRRLVNELAVRYPAVESVAEAKAVVNPAA